MRARGGQAEDVGGELHGRVALRAAAGNAQLGDGRAGALLQPLLALAQPVGQPLQDRPVEMGARVHVGEADDRTHGLRPRHLEPRRPVRLEHEPVAARRHVGDEIVEQLFRRHALRLGKL